MNPASLWMTVQLASTPVGSGLDLWREDTDFGT